MSGPSYPSDGSHSFHGSDKSDKSDKSDRGSVPAARSTTAADIPRGNATGLVRYFPQDFLAGFLVFLIALPLCLGISLACGYPAIAGIFTAIIGAIVTTMISNSELTIKGPAAGLIVIAVGCIEAFGGDGAIGGFNAADMAAYRMALAVGVAAALLQIMLGIARAGVLGEFFPLSAVHGMLAAIGVIIIVKQVPVALGVSAKGEPLEMIREMPRYLREMNPAIALIGVVGVAIMFLWPVLQKQIRQLKCIPAALVVLLVTVPLGMYCNLLQDHTYTFHGHRYHVGEAYLVTMPDRIFGMFDYITTPDFSVLISAERAGEAWKWVFMFFVIGSLESILSAKAVDVIDPWKRKTNLDRDIVAVGVANLASAMVGGLPMISEIVRSKANIDNGARTRFADMWHGLLLLACVALIPSTLHRIPLAALAAMLIYTGFRLTHPAEFVQMYRIGKEQFLVFVATLVGVLATDLLVGILIGIAVELVIYLSRGVPLRSVFKPYLDVEPRDDNTVLIRAQHSAIFSNWILFRRKLIHLGLEDGQNVILDLAHTRLVDHSVMEKLHELEEEFYHCGLELKVIGLEGHRQLSEHPRAARIRAMTRLRRVTVIADSDFADVLSGKFVEFGASGYTSIPCWGAGRRELACGDVKIGAAQNSQVRLEAVVPENVADRILAYLRTEVSPSQHITACLETVEVLRRDQF
jgi:MFS superfamily sulfate permease-like transporter